LEDINIPSFSALSFRSTKSLRLKTYHAS